MPGIAASRSLELAGDREVVGAVVADGAHVDLGGNAEIEDLRHHVGGLEIEGHLGERRRQHLAQLVHVARGRRMAFLEGDQDHAVVDADRGAVREGEIVVARRQSDVVEDLLALVLRESPRGSCPRSPGRSARSVRCGCRPARARAAGSGRRRSSGRSRGRRRRYSVPPRVSITAATAGTMSRRVKQHGEDVGVAVAHGLEAALEAGVKAPEQTRASRLGCRGARP